MTSNIARSVRGFFQRDVKPNPKLALTDPSEPVTIASGNNPLLLTNEQVGKGWRLLTVQEIEQNDDTDAVNRFNSEFQCWSPYRQRWESGFDGNNVTRSYRVKTS